LKKADLVLDVKTLPINTLNALHEKYGMELDIKTMEMKIAEVRWNNV